MNARLPLVLRCLAVLLLLVVPSLAQATTLNVPSANYPTIQSGINASHDGDTVLVADGNYTGDGNRDIDFVGKNITVTSQHGAGKTIIDCQGNISTTHRGFYIHSNELKATISGFTVKNGYEYSSGGGIDIESFIGGTINVTGCILTSSNTYYNGGGISSNNYGGIITLTDCTVTGNTSVYGAGGGISNTNFVNSTHPDSSQSGTITLTRCTVTNNNASYNGGGVYDYNNGTGTITLSNCRIAGNILTSVSYGSGGGIDSFNNDGGIVSFISCTVSGNSAAYGAGVLNDNYGSGTTTMTACAISKNIAQFGGGGVYDYNNGGTATVTACEITGNTASSGGGVYDYNDNGMSALTNCTINENTVLYGGGGVFHDGNATFALTNCTLTGNTAYFGSGIYDNSGPVTLINDILYDDVSKEVPSSEIVGFGISATNCDIKSIYPVVYPGIGNINADPLFINAVAGDVHLKPGSPCLGAGTWNGAPTTDKDGQLRPYPPSIGAYELTLPPATITYFNLSTSQIDAPGAQVSAYVLVSGTFSKMTVTIPRGSLGIVSPTFTLTSGYYEGIVWYGTFPTAFLKLAKTNPVTFIATGTRADGSTATMTTTLQINNRPTLTLSLYPNTPIVVPRNNKVYLYSFVGNFTGTPALYTTVQITLPPGIDFVSADGFTYNATTRTLTQGIASLNFHGSSIVLQVSATASTQTPLTISAIATCPGFQQAVQNTIVQVIP